MNATRLYTLKYSNGRGNVLSVGRVQTPTLALIVERHFQIVNFKPEDYWELKTNYRDVTFNATSGKFKKIEDAQAALQQIQSKPFTVDTVTQKQGREAPLRLFDLTSLQVECNKRWGWTADETLKLIQTLYEKKVTTYPRVDTTYLSTDIYPKVPDILSRMAPYANVTAPVLAKKIPMSKKIFDNSKVTDHHAIIPTGESPLSLVGDEKKMYHLIAMRFIAAFYPDCIFSTTTVLGSVEKIGFKAVGKVIVDPGWRALFAKDNDKTDDKDSENDDNRILPPFVEGETGPHTPALNKKTTQPPKLYTEGTLLRAMETAGKNVDEEELREAMKENGIGRPSTRSAIIETLFKRRYIKRERKNIVATQAGIDLIATIHEELLKSAKLTGLWENKLRRIERGDYSAAEFLTELKTMVSQIVYNVLNDNSGFQINVEQPAAKTAKPKKEAKPRAPRKKKVTDLAKIKCPKCGKGHIIKGRTAYGCSNYAKGCDMLLPFAQYSADLTPQELYDKLNEK
jgi:DNA topoisomerase-3